MESPPPIRSRAPEEGSIQIPLWSVPLILILLYVCLFNGLGSVGLIGPDEPRYAAIARAMAETHDWITPRLWGTPWFEKPVLYYWTAGVAMRIFRVSEFSARLPSALAALLAVAAAGWTALRAYGVGAAWFTFLMLPSSVAFIGFSRAASPDMLFAGLLTAAMAVACEMLQRPQPSLGQRVAFGFFLGAGVLAKGPAAVVLAGGAVLCWSALSRNWRASLQFLHPLTIAVFCAIALPWYVLCALRNPDFLPTFLWQHNFERYLTPVFQHQQPVWFYVPILGLAVFPWFIVAVCSACIQWNRERWRDSPSLFYTCWAVFPFLFFSFSQSKLPGYILPSIPPLFLLASRVGVRVLEFPHARSTIFVAVLTGAWFPVIALASKGILFKTGDLLNVPSARVLALVAVAVIGGLIAMVFGVAKKYEGVFALVALLTAALVMYMTVAILPFADSRLSARGAARDFMRLDPSGQDMATYRLSRDWRYGLNYYLGRELAEWAPGTPLPEWLITTSGGAAEVRRLGNQMREASRVGAPFAVLIQTSPLDGDHR